MSLWYNEIKQTVEPVLPTLAKSDCNRCGGPVPVIHKLRNIICSQCRTVLFSR